MKKIIEKWVWIIGYEGMYQVSNLGRVKSFQKGKEKNIHLSDRGNGYLSVSLYKKGIIKKFYIHQLVCQTFNDDYFIGCGKVVNHINGIRTDNRVENLEIVTQRDNVSSSKCYRKDNNKLTSKYDNVSWHNQHKKWYSNIYFNGKLYHLGLFIIEEDARDYSVLALSHINNNTFEDFILTIKNTRIKSVNQYSKSGEFIRTWNNQTEVSRELNISKGNICQCCRGKQKTAGGFVWKYASDCK